MTGTAWRPPHRAMARSARLASALVFLRLNGSSLHVPGNGLYALTMQIATGEADDEVAAAYLRSRIEAP
jgi:prophage maintenance system killer protein